MKSFWVCIEGASSDVVVINDRTQLGFDEDYGRASRLASELFLKAQEMAIRLMRMSWPVYSFIRKDLSPDGTVRTWLNPPGANHRSP